MQRKLGFIELSGHHEVLWSYLKVALLISEEIHVWTYESNTKQLYEFLSDPKINWNVLDEKKDIKTQLQKDESTLNKCQHIIYTTILPKQYKALTNLQISTKKLLVIHKINRLLNPMENLNINSPKDVAKWVRHYTFQEEKRNQKFLESCDGFILPSQAVLESCTSLFESHGLHKPIVLPFSVANEIEENTKNEIVNMVIPGSITQESRDYDMIIETLQSIAPEITTNVCISLLGAPVAFRDFETIKEIRLLENEFITVQTYDQYISQEIYDQELKKASFLLLPISEIMKGSPIKEQRSKTCVSGNINDMVKYRKPALLPSFYTMPSDLTGTYRGYENSKELGDILLDWIHNESFQSLNHFQFDNFSASNLAMQWKSSLDI